MTPAVDVVIVSYNTRDDLDACLASIEAAPPAALGAIFVVDNASADGTPAHVRERRPRVRLIALDRNVGFAAANNIAIRESTAPLVLLLNSDTIVPAGAIDALVTRREATGATVIGPRLVDGRGRPEVSFGPMLTPLAEAVQRLRVRAAASEGALARRYVERLVSRERTVDWVSGAALLVARDPAIAAGLLDERYFLYEEDVDFCASIRAHGGRVVFTPRVDIVHLRGRSVARATPGSHALYDRAHVTFYEKHAPRWAPWLRRWLAVRGRTVR
ncbi:MAG TPA: glycosyltransferase family 2 protein [Vicinamibacterales bacterium]|nr:glycosyltransferase family 2 protein [Vicinamibacterales bacterium]